MSENLEETIPAYSMWKMLNETIIMLRKGPSEAFVQKLVNIIQSKESSNIFICYKDPAMTFEQYQETLRRYKAFTIWILGEFFYLLSTEKLAKLHDIIIEAQLCILKKLSRTLLHIYHEFTCEYYTVLHELINFIKYDETKLNLKAFVPEALEDLSSKLNLTQIFVDVTNVKQCVELIGKLLKLTKQFLIESFTFYNSHHNLIHTFDDMIFILEEIDPLRIDTFEIFLEILSICDFKYLNLNLQEKFFAFSSIFEQYCYKVYDCQLKINQNDFDKFENMLLTYLQISPEIFCNVTRINQYLFKKLITKSTNKPCYKVSLMAIQSNALREIPFNALNSADFSQSVLIYTVQQQLVKDLSSVENSSFEIIAYNKETSVVWNAVHGNIMENLKNLNCNETCYLEKFLEYFHHTSNVLMRVRLELIKKNIRKNVKFFNEANLLCSYINTVSNHTNKCKQTSITTHRILSFLLPFVLVSNSKNLNTIFNFLAHPLLKHSTYNTDQLNFITTNNVYNVQHLIKSFMNYLRGQEVSKEVSLGLVKDFFEMISSDLVDLNECQKENIETQYLEITKECLQTFDLNVITLIIETVPHAMFFFNDVDRLLSETFTVTLCAQNKEITEKTVQILPSVLCSISNEIFKTFNWDDDNNKLKSNIVCKKCDGEPSKSVVNIRFAKVRAEDAVIDLMFKNVLSFITNGRKELKIFSLGVLPAFSQHLHHFHSTNVAKIWLELAGDSDEEVRKKFIEVVRRLIDFKNTELLEDVKVEIHKVVFDFLLDLTKKSLKFSNFPLQSTIIDVIEELLVIKLDDNIIMELVKIILYLIMVPTSKYSLVAVNKYFNLAKANSVSTTVVFNQNKKEFCSIIVHLCYVNQALLNYFVSTSLEKISLMLGYYGSKEFVSQECNYLIPFFVSKTIEAPAVTKLIQELADMMELDVAELLTCKYGYVFIHIFLDLPKAEFKQCMQYLEKVTGLSGPTLRKRNFRIILNELLLNFHEKKTSVTLALQLISEEDTDNRTTSLQDYLQPHLLGVLLNFDVKLISKNLKKDKILLSLADLFRYMGSKHIMPLRFKIVAMLQTASYDYFPELNCQVWDAFLKTCEIEALGSQLATIFASLTPLLQQCPNEVNNIFKYLIVDNETSIQNHIPDLFFVINWDIDPQVKNVIKKHLRSLNSCNLKEKINKFLKYLTHEMIEVRVHGLKHLKGFLEESREELDKMILDYNGIDSTIVELIDILTSGCREEDESLRLACGEVLGEIGAIEPSNLPRRYVHNQNSFSFYIHESTFITNCLNELIRAFQAGKNTQSMDRYALAIQEILKEYEISPDKERSLWYEFPESQREVMLPLLSSRYVINQPVLVDGHPTPIYGSNSGASFQLWLYNWACTLIASLPHCKKKHLIVCLPSMKQDNRILMHFLPHILLHALLEGTDDISEKALLEIKTVTNSCTEQKSLDPKVLNLRSIPIPEISTSFPTLAPEGVKKMQCTKVVFLLLDFLERWTREWQWQKEKTNVPYNHYSIITDFLKKLCKLQLAKCNYNCGEYPRALLYLEDYISANSSEMSDHLGFLAEIYAQLEEPDGVDGVTALRSNEPSIEERILALEVSGKLEYASKCYEKLLETSDLHHIQGLVQCQLNLDNTNTALYSAKGALENRLDFGNMSFELQAEPLWRLSRWDDLTDLIKLPELATNKSWPIQISRALLNFKNCNSNAFESVSKELLKQQVLNFGAASLEEGAYQHGYAYVSKLHALNEFQKMEKMINKLLLRPNDKQYAELLIENLAKEWLLRIKVVQESVRIVEPIMSLRIVLLNLTRDIGMEKFPQAVEPLESLIGECWLLSAKFARTAKMHQQAYAYALRAEKFSPSTLFLEKAKLHWAREEHQEALRILDHGVKFILLKFPSANNLPLEQKKICAEARLLIATYNEEISNVDVEMNLHHYKEAYETYKEWEKSMVCIAQYYDKIFETYSEADRDGKGGDLQLHMINYFGKSLQYGTSYVYQSMPRLLSIWFDYGTRLLSVLETGVKEQRKVMLLQMTKLIDSFLERLPTYIFLTAFSQLVSRICHPQREVYSELKCIIIKLIQQYPQQSLWMIISVIKSSYPVRAKRCQEIFSDARLKSATLTKLIKDFTTFAEKLIELCNKQINNDLSSVTVSNLVRSLPRLLNKNDFSQIMMPTHKFRKLILPNPDFTSSQHNPFPNHYVHIVGIEEHITILASLQRPRKITLKGSDGKGYIFMLKPKDDLRKDFRLMEFNDIVNQLLVREGEARQRRLNIRLYSVAPLNEECGLIEWVSDLVGLRPVLLNLYKQRGLGLKNKELKEMSCQIKDPLQKKRDIFLKKFLPKHPPVLNEWFRKTFPDAQSWFTARTAYIRTTAVMSIAGYILGLGDRHGENIQLDSTCGDIVHVDFNCLFNKGEKFDWPERVPFRLTHNMVAAMGPLGTEGMFRRSCICTLKVLRDNTDTLMSIVTPFVYDPLVSWTRTISALPSVHSSEKINEEAMDHIKNIELRLQGRVKTRFKTLLKPLSVEGQVNYLINEAVSIDNLCQMYIGWGPYL